MSGRTPRKLNAEQLWDYALRLLGLRAYAAGEMRERLARRAERAEDIAPVLARLKQRGYLNDQSFAESFSTARLENEGFGKQRVLRDLRKRRIAPSIAEKAVNAVYEETDEAELIENFLRRKYRNVRLDEYLSDRKNLAAAYRRLRTAGFSSGNVIRALTKFAGEPEMLDSLEEPDEGTGA